MLCPAPRPSEPSTVNGVGSENGVNKSTEITAKLFLPQGISVEQAILNVKTALKAFKECFYKGTQIKYFILSFGGVIFSDDDEEEDVQTYSDEGIFEIWKATVEAGNSEHLADDSTLIEQYGVSEFSTKRLSTLLDNITKSSTNVRPSINHINAADCCALPQSLVTLAKEVNIKLLAHHDPENLLPQSEVDSLSVEIAAKFDKQREASRSSSYQWNWILKMTHLAKDRQVLTRNEALVSIGLRT